MIDRIKQVMAFKKLSATQFSDEIEIQRSSLSHVLSGRNKPSLDFMMKIKNTYPEIELDWLLMGKGEMFKKTDESEILDKEEQNEIEPSPEINFSNPVEIDETAASNEIVTKVRAVTENNDTEKKLSRVLLFYTDNTFECFDAQP